MVLGTVITMQIITFVVMTFLGALLLMLSAKIFKLKDQSFKTAIKITLILYVIGLVLGLIGIFSLSLAVIMSILSFIVVIALGIYLIKTMYKLELGKAALVWLVWFIMSLIVGFIVGLIMAVIFAGAIAASLTI